MQIRFISTLTAEDEDRLAAMIVDTAKALLAHSPLGYMLRIETTDAKLFEHNKVAPSATVTEVSLGRPTKARRFESELTPIQSLFDARTTEREDHKDTEQQPLRASGRDLGS